MPRIKLTFILSFSVLILLLLCSLTFAQQTVSSENTIATFPLESLEAGLMGTAITAGAGNELTEFPIEVLALQRDLLPGAPLVLFRASGPFIEEVGGVAAGMSGSPVYIEQDGESLLLGAIGYTFPSSDHTLGLITPFEFMRQAPPLSSLDALPSFANIDVADLGEPVAVATPLLFSGISERVASRLEPLFTSGNMQLMPMQSLSAGNFKEEDYVFQPGSAVSVELSRGDISLAAVGTVTAIDEENGLFWAFGHPFLQRSNVSYGLSPAYVTHIVPSDIVPFKLANGGFGNLGTVTEDNQYAISGLLDVQPDFLPITLSISALGKQVTKIFQVSNDERFYAVLLAASSLGIMDELFAVRRQGTIDIAWEVDVKGGQTVRMLEQIADNNDIAFESSILLAGPLAILGSNFFEDPEVSNVNISINYSPDINVADVIEVHAEPSQELEEQDTLIAHVRLQPYRQQAEVVTLDIDLPEGVTGELDIIFRGGTEPSPQDDNNDGIDDKLLSFGELLVAMREQSQGSELIVETKVDGDYQRLARKQFPFLIIGEETLTVQIGSEEDAQKDAKDDIVDEEKTEGQDSTGREGSNSLLEDERP